jgi:hypothetical protein
MDTETLLLERRRLSAQLNGHRAAIAEPIENAPKSFLGLPFPTWGRLLLGFGANTVGWQRMSTQMLFSTAVPLLLGYVQRKTEGVFSRKNLVDRVFGFFQGLKR